MRIVVLPTAADAAQFVADDFEKLLATKPNAVLGLAAGRTPELAYRLVCERHPIVDQAAAVLLDEYVGLSGTDDQSFRHQIQTTFTDPISLDPSRLYSLDGLATDPAATCAGFEDSIRALGGIDLQLLGVGRNGHIGFNEPGSSHLSRTRSIQLTETTRNDNATAFGSIDLVPASALTQGIGTILEARQIILLATGVHKADAIAAAIQGPVTEAVPVSALQRHPNTTVVVDAAAAQRC